MKSRAGSDSLTENLEIFVCYDKVCCHDGLGVSVTGFLSIFLAEGFFLEVFVRQAVSWSEYCSTNAEGFLMRHVVNPLFGRGLSPDLTDM